MLKRNKILWRIFLFSFLILRGIVPLFSQTAPPDTLKKNPSRSDSLIKPEIKFFYEENFDLSQNGFNSYNRPDTSVDKIHIWDEMYSANIGSFIQSFGQTGKPGIAYTFGIKNRYLELRQFRNPITDEYNPYIIHPDFLQYYDTKTPYTDLTYVQGPNELQIFKGTFSQNVTPNFNFSAYYGRLKSEGAYPFQVSDHQNIALTTSYHTKNKRYTLLVNGTFSVLNNEENGGVVNDSTKTFMDLFRKQFTEVALIGDDGKSGQRKNRSETVQTYQYFNFFSDSSLKNMKLQLENSIQFRHFKSRFTYSGYSSVFPNIYIDSTFTEDRYDYWARIVALGINQSFVTGHHKLLQKFYVELSDIYYQDEMSNIFLNDIRDVHWKYNYQLSYKFFTIKSATTRELFFIHSDNYFIPRDDTIRNMSEIYSDSWCSVRIKKDDFLFIRNIFSQHDFSMYEKFAYANTYRGYYYFNYNDFLRPVYNLTSLGINLSDFKTPHQGLLITSHQTFNVRIFGYNRYNLYYSVAQHQLLYTKNDNTYGITGTFGQKFFKRIMLSGNFNYEPSASGGRNTFPELSGQLTLAYDDFLFKKKLQFYGGVTASYFSSYYGKFYDPTAEIFYSPLTKIESYTLLDAFINFKVQRARFFLKMEHFNENFWAPGYFTIPNYPMPQRRFIFGLNWTFFN